ncbi:MAG: ATP-binding protein [Deltaproteobacteria bacterium]|nr:ATP-binding protein [Deltaproteobacteria bacterium]
MIPRHLATVLRREATRNPVVTVLGPRQSGKTTLVRSTFPEHAYRSLERPDERSAAREDPLAWLASCRGGTIIDEVQRVPDLLSYLQVNVDEDDTPGRFILTGSQNLLLMQSVAQTLAGRTAILHLYPFSLSELFSRPPIDSTAPFAGEIGAPPDKRSLWEIVWMGLYPRIHDKDLDPRRWLGDYFRTYVERDLRDVLAVMDLQSFERFMRLVAARTGSELNLTSLASDAGISQPTAKRWISSLSTGFLIALLPPHFANYRKRLRKRPKLHVLDTGLVCYLLGIQDPASLACHPLRGSIFESFVVGELIKAFAHAGRDAPLFHWRDATGHEVDVLIDLGDRLLPIEVKSGSTLASDTIDGLRWWTGLPANPNDTGILVHGGVTQQVRGAIRIVPWYLQ